VLERASGQPNRLLRRVVRDLEMRGHGKRVLPDVAPSYVPECYFGFPNSSQGAKIAAAALSFP
jgi:hypothetical protein